jgi:CPA2 family monovalent cation:H+ antiporter-2
VTYIMARGADKVVMGEREIANNMLDSINIGMAMPPRAEGCTI